MAITTRLKDLSFQAPLFLARLRQLVTQIDDRASSIWSLKRLQGCPLRRLHRISSLNTCLAASQLMDINTLRKVHVGEELTIISDAEIILNTHWNEDIM